MNDCPLVYTGLKMLKFILDSKKKEEMNILLSTYIVTAEHWMSSLKDKLELISDMKVCIWMYKKYKLYVYLSIRFLWIMKAWRHQMIWNCRRFLVHSLRSTTLLQSYWPDWTPFENYDLDLEYVLASECIINIIILNLYFSHGGFDNIFRLCCVVRVSTHSTAWLINEHTELCSFLEVSSRREWWYITRVITRYCGE